MESMQLALPEVPWLPLFTPVISIILSFAQIDGICSTLGVIKFILGYIIFALGDIEFILGYINFTLGYIIFTPGYNIFILF